jgi:hypothetical protein
MADIIQFPNINERAIAQFVEGFGLEYPNDAKKLFEIIGRFKGGGTMGKLFDALVEAFPDKKERILNTPIYAKIDGELVRVRLPEKD